MQDKGTIGDLYKLRPMTSMDLVAADEDVQSCNLSYYLYGREESRYLASGLEVGGKLKVKLSTALAVDQRLSARSDRQPRPEEIAPQA